jgi:4-hydroxy-tetrahydrodipicolinate synthase
MNLWSGNDDQALPLLALGGKGLISVAANLIPSPMAELTHAFRAGDLDRARDLQLTLLPLIQALFLQVNPIPIKTAMALAGLDSGTLRLPLCPMDQEPKAALVAELGKLGM